MPTFEKKIIYIEFLICGGTDLIYDSYSIKVTFLGRMPITVFTCQVGYPSQTGFFSNMPYFESHE